MVRDVREDKSPPVATLDIVEWVGYVGRCPDHMSQALWVCSPGAPSSLLAGPSLPLASSPFHRRLGALQNTNPLWCSPLCQLPGKLRIKCKLLTWFVKPMMIWAPSLPWLHLQPSLPGHSGSATLAALLISNTSNSFLPQDLCTCTSLCLENPFPRYICTLLLHFNEISA